MLVTCEQFVSILCQADALLMKHLLKGIRVWGSHNLIRRNLVTLTLWPGSYQGRAETFNYDWTASIEVSDYLHGGLHYCDEAAWDLERSRNVQQYATPTFHNLF